MSMYVAFVAFALWKGQGANVTFAEPLLNLQFDHPANWKLLPPVKKKGLKPLNDRATFEAPVESGHAPATIEVVRTSFNAATDIWQNLQIEVNQQLKREVVRQWQQDILSIPTLFTKSIYKQGDVPMSSLNGLFYMRGSQKMLLRLVCESAIYDKAQAMLVTAMESLRTIDGTSPAPEDPNRKPDPNEPKKPVRAARPVEVGAVEPVKLSGNVIGTFTVANRTYQLRTHGDWKWQEKSGRATLASVSQSASWTVEPRSTLDSEAPDRLLAARANKALDLFDKVDLREDKTIVSKAGSTVTWIARTGSDKKGLLIRQELTALKGDVYLLFAIESRNQIAFDRDSKTLLKLLDGLIIEPVGK